MKRQSYPVYKPSGVEWLGEIPESWKLMSLRRLLRVSSGDMTSASNFTDAGYPVFGGNGFRGYVDRYNTEANTIIIGRYGALCGNVRITDERIWATEHAFRVIPLVNFDPVFISHLIEVLDLNRLSARTAQPGLNSEMVRDHIVALPPVEQQRTIAAYLDRETVRLDALIEKKQRQIELLQEKRIALIHDAIHNSSTRTMRIGHVADQIFRPIPRKDDDTYTPVGLYNWGRGIFHKEPTAGAELGDSNFFWLDADDLILSGQFAWEGAVALTSEKDKGCVATHRYPILRGNPGVMETAYLFAFFTTKTGDFLLNEHSRGAAGRNRPLNAGTLLKESIPVPPLETQSRVSAHVYFERRIVPIIERAIQLLQEYRTSLISAAVTGKIDVRKEPT